MEINIILLECSMIYLVWQINENERDSITVFSTGCPIIDKTLGGGIRLGQITELYGESGCGKTQLCIQMSLEIQRTFRARGQEASKIFFIFFVNFHNTSF
jgi:RecA/RadA recombinase